MAKSMLRREIEVYSEKYDIHGVVRDYGVVTKLFFSHRGKEIEMGIGRNLDLLGQNYEDVGCNIIDTYVSSLSVQEGKRKLQLHYWYIDEKEVDGKVCRFGHGVVTGHTYLQDSMFINTSQVRAVSVNEEDGELILTTKNSVYHCPLEYCRFKEQDNYPDLVPEYEAIKRKHKDAIKHPYIESGRVLLVLSNFCEYYFHSLHYTPRDSEERKQLDYVAYPHIGMFQDSYLVCTEDYSVDIRYFPHYQNIEFYNEKTDGRPFYIENIGDAVIYAESRKGTFKLEPGERKCVIKRNAEKARPVLPGGDLYPAGVIE